MTDLSNVRKEYGLNALNRQDCADDPHEQFDKWYQQASQTVAEANAAVLATSHRQQPSQRLVLLKSYDEFGYVFYSNYRSRKAEDLRQNPKASFLFWWRPLERQVRLEGTIEILDKELSDQYFASRDRAAQLGALASKQSQVIADRSELDRRMQELVEHYNGREIKRPDFWGGYRLMPHYFEFWQGRANRLHDRFMYQLNDTQTWDIKRLAP